MSAVRGRLIRSASLSPSAIPSTSFYAICLRACYAMSVTDLAYGPTSACAGIAESAQLVAPPNGPTRTLRDVRVLSAYAMSGTDRAYGATCALCDVRY
eukprot:3503734-Rhodomonas_salina.3